MEGAGQHKAPPSAVTDALPQDKQGVGSAVNDLARELGGALGIAVLGSVLQTAYRDQLHPQLANLPLPLAERARSSLALANRMDPKVAQGAQQAFVHGMQYALLTGAAAVALAAVTVLILHDAQTRTAHPAHEA